MVYAQQQESFCVRGERLKLWHFWKAKHKLLRAISAKMKNLLVCENEIGPCVTWKLRCGIHRLNFFVKSNGYIVYVTRGCHGLFMKLN